MFTQSPVKIWRNQKKIVDILGKTGKVVSFTVIRVPPAGFEDQAPYPVVICAVNGHRVVGQLVDCKAEDLKLGMKVRATLRRVKNPGKEGIIPYGIKFKPL